MWNPSFKRFGRGWNFSCSMLVYRRRQVADVSEEPPKLSSYVLAGDFLDCTPFNLLDIDGELVPIDEEWQSENDISLGWVITRGVLWSMPSGMSSGSLAPSLLELIEALCGSFELAVSETDRGNLAWPGSRLPETRHWSALRTADHGKNVSRNATFRKRDLQPESRRSGSLQQTVATREVDVANLRTTLGEREPS